MTNEYSLASIDQNFRQSADF
ncbi:protein of unknown function [Burkholderia multivorans]